METPVNSENEEDRYPTLMLAYEEFSKKKEELNNAVMLFKDLIDSEEIFDSAKMIEIISNYEGD